MKIKKLGDLVVTTAAYGFMYVQQKNAIKLFETAYKNGVRFFDTADFYSDGKNEENLGQAIIATEIPRENFILSTKCGCLVVENQVLINNSKDYILTACNASLKRLQTKYIDLYYIHRLAKDITDDDLDEILEALKLLLKQGKIHHIGFSELTAEQVLWINDAARRKGLKIAAIQNEISLWYYDESLISTCKNQSIGVVAYSPLARGFLTNITQEEFMIKNMGRGDFRHHIPRLEKYLSQNFIARKLLEQLVYDNPEIAVSLAELSLAWLSNLDEHVVAIPGTNSVVYLQENIQSAYKDLTKAQVDLISETVRKSHFFGEAKPLSFDENMKSFKEYQILSA